MNKITLISNYKISDRNGEFSCGVDYEDKKILIGLPKDFDFQSPDINLISDYQVVCNDIPNYYTRLFQQSKENRYAVEKIVSYLEKNKKYKLHMGKNLEALLGFVYSRYNLSISQCISDFYENVNVNKSTDYPDYSDDYKSFENMIHTAKLQQKSLLLAGCFTAYYLVSPSYIENGYGVCYLITSDLSQEQKIKFNEKYNEYLSEQFELWETKLKEWTEEKNKKYKKEKKELDVDNVYNIEGFLNSVGLEGKYEKFEIQNMYKCITFDKTYSNLIEEFLNDK